MGNEDLVVIFNDKVVITIKGTDYSVHEDGIRKAIDKFYSHARFEIDEWLKAEKENPEFVNKDFDIIGYWELKLMRVFSN